MLADQLIVGDCLDSFAAIEDGSVDLVVTDPPFNIDFGRYDIYDDNRDADEYLDWCSQWLAEVKRVLSPTGSFWLAIGDAFVSELDLLCRKTFGFHRRNWVCWTYSFGVNCTKRFTPSKTHLLNFVVDPKRFTFNADAVKVPSARQMVYGDRRAKAGGRLPDDVWVLRHPEAAQMMAANADIWFFPRVCGTFKERVAHPCQMPEAVLDRIVSVSSNPGDLVLDPFAGSGTTLVAAKRLGRRYVGFELSAAYAAIAEARLDAVASIQQEQEIQCAAS